MKLKMIFNFLRRRFPRRSAASEPGALSELHVGQSAILGELEVTGPIAEHLMNLGFLPGSRVTVARSGPGGDPRVYRVEGTEVAMRRELSRHIQVRLTGAAAFGD